MLDKRYRLSCLARLLELETLQAGVESPVQISQESRTSEESECNGYCMTACGPQDGGPAELAGHLLGTRRLRLQTMQCRFDKHVVQGSIVQTCTHGVGEKVNFRSCLMTCALHAAMR